jgi:hypothetical protein
MATAKGTAQWPIITPNWQMLLLDAATSINKREVIQFKSVLFIEVQASQHMY